MLLGLAPEQRTPIGKLPKRSHESMPVVLLRFREVALGCRHKPNKTSEG
jgi:hypothetical protein